MTKTIQTEIGKMQVLKHHIAVENIQLLTSFECDVASIGKSGMIYEFEVKISRADFIKDKSKKYKWANKSKFDIYQTEPDKAPNFFSYCCPQGLINEIEIPSFSGLYYFNGNEIIEVRKPKQLHNVKHDLSKIHVKILRVNSERMFLGCCRLTYENREIKKRNAEILELHKII